MKLFAPHLSLAWVVLTASGVLAGCGQFRHEHAWRDDGPQVVDVRPSSGSPSVAAAPKPKQIMATGYAVVSVQNHRNPSQQRLLAMRASKLEAYRALTEQVYGQQLDANTTVADMTLTSDGFRARVEGVIFGAELISITPRGDDLYETTLALERSVVDELRALYLAQLTARASR